MEEISARTCISVRQLDALETNRLERLPGGLFNISFARQYAKQLGLNEEKAAQLIKEAMGLPTQPQAKMSAGRAGFSLDGPASKLAEWATDFFRKHGGSVASIVVGATLIGGGFYSFQFIEKTKQEPVKDPVVQAAPKITPPAAQPVQVVSTPTVVEEYKQAAPIELTLEVIETVWVRAVVDGKRMFEETLSQGVVKPISAQQQIELKVGNAAGVLLSLNGHDLPAIGPRGRVTSLTVTPQGVEEQEPEVRRPSNSTTMSLPQTTVAIRWAELAWSRPIR